MSTRFRVARVPGKCSYQACRRTIPEEHYLCGLHYGRFHAGLIAECEGGCGRFLPAGYPYCPDCDERTGQEYEPHWKARDADSAQFWVYILRLEPEGPGGSETAELYAGQTRELTCRIMDHLDGECASTWGRKPALVWFAEVPNRNAATELEAELKQEIQANRRAVLRRIAAFQAAVPLVSAYPSVGAALGVEDPAAQAAVPPRNDSS